MLKQNLRVVASDIPGITAAIVVAMPDCLHIGSWEKGGESLPMETLGTYFGDLVRSNRAAMRVLEGDPEHISLTIESLHRKVLIREVSKDFVLGVVFTSETPLGVARMGLERMVLPVSEELKAFEITERPRIQRAMDHLMAYGAEAHVMLDRIAIQTGIPTPRLRDESGTLKDDEIELVIEKIKKLTNSPNANF